MQHSPIAIEQSHAEERTPLPLRDDTMLGICEALGQDFGFHPSILRLSLGVGLLWNPPAIVGIYLGLGVLVAASRLLFPAQRKPAAVVVPVEAPVAAVATAEQQQEREPELIAA